MSKFKERFIETFSTTKKLRKDTKTIVDDLKFKEASNQASKNISLILKDKFKRTKR